MDDYFDEDYDAPCPQCGKMSTRYQDCTVVGCDDGSIDLHEYDDPINFSPGETEVCNECNGTGIQAWCPQCGWTNARTTRRR